MFSIAELLDRAKVKGNIESDYRLAKILRINQTLISNWRHGRNLPNPEMIEALCALSGDDAGLVVAQVEAARAADGPVRAMWLSVAKRLAGGASTAILSVLFAIGFIAASPDTARDGQLVDQKISATDLLYIVSTGVFVRLERLRCKWRGLPGFFRLCWLSC